MSLPAHIKNLTSSHVAQNVAWLRERQKLSYAELSRRTIKVGHPLPILALQRLEKGQRRIDVDDLSTLAMVLQTSVLQLLTPQAFDDDQDLLEYLASDDTPYLTGLPPLTLFETTAWLAGDLTDLSPEGRWQFNADHLDHLRVELENLEDKISSLSPNSTEKYELRGTSLALEQEIDYLARHVHKLSQSTSDK